MDPATLRRLAGLVLAGGAALVAYAVWLGQAEVGLFVVFPFLVGHGPVALAGMVLLFAGFVALFFAFAVGPPAWPGDRGGWGPVHGPGRSREAAERGPEQPPEGDRSASRAEGGGVVLIGPIPIVFGTDRRWAVLAALGGVLLVLALLVVFLLARA